MPTPLPIQPPNGRLGVLTPGMGAVATTFYSGVLAVRQRRAIPIGSLTQMGHIRLGKRTDNRNPLIKELVPLADLDDIVFGGWDPILPFAPFTLIPGIIWFLLKIAFFFFVFSWVKATVPRYRYDQLMRLGWKVFLPISLAWVVITAGVLVTFDLLPVKG